MIGFPKSARVLPGKVMVGAKEIMAAMNTGGIPDPRGDEIRSALVDLAGERAVNTARSVGMVLKYREGRIVQGLHLTSRADSVRGAKMFRVRNVENGTNGTNGTNPPARAKLSNDSSGEGGETNPLVPLVPFSDPDAFDPEAW